jgi:hypothetical protein
MPHFGDDTHDAEHGIAEAVNVSSQQPASPDVRPLAVQHDFVRVQRLTEVVVHRRIVEPHRQNVVHGRAVAAQPLYACLRADHRSHGEVLRMGRAPGIFLGFDDEDLNWLVAVDPNTPTLAGVDQDLGAAGRHGNRSVGVYDLAVGIDWPIAETLGHGDSRGVSEEPVPSKTLRAVGWYRVWTQDTQRALDHAEADARGRTMYDDAERGGV